MKKILITALISGTLLATQSWADDAKPNVVPKTAFLKVTTSSGDKAEYKPVDGLSLNSKKNSPKASGSTVAVTRGESCSKKDSMKEGCKAHCGDQH